MVKRAAIRKRVPERPGSRSSLSGAELFTRARQIRLVLTDSDGVLTDTGVYYSERGEEMKRFSIRDGMGVELLRAAGMQTAIITGESSPAVQRRAEKLQLPGIYMGIRNKQAQLDQICKESGYKFTQLAYIGDDVNDLDAMATIRALGLTGAPMDAVESIRSLAHCQCRAKGGNGAFREFADWIIMLRNGASTGRQER